MPPDDRRRALRTDREERKGRERGFVLGQRGLGERLRRPAAGPCDGGSFRRFLEPRQESLDVTSRLGREERKACDAERARFGRLDDLVVARIHAGYDEERAHGKTSSLRTASKISRAPSASARRASSAPSSAARTVGPSIDFRIEGRPSG